MAVCVLLIAMATVVTMGFSPDEHWPTWLFVGLICFSYDIAANRKRV
jgi:hypothetical protein